MPRSKTHLPDVNVWLARASERHVHAALCSHWLERVESDELIVCRVTQMGLLRLLTNTSVMADDVLTSRAAWGIYRTLLADHRIRFMSEPHGVEEQWRKLTTHDRPAPKTWTDAYLVAFARSAALQLVTLDRAVLSLAPEAVFLH